LVQNYDPEEIQKFNSYADLWWDPAGKMGTLHTINPLRVSFIMDNPQIPQPRILDVGCGGGILSEALAEAGARVTGIDLSPTAIEVARDHARENQLSIDYLLVPVEEYAQAHPAQFDAVIGLEMLEHVPRPDQVIGACARALKPGGTAVFSSINRSLKSFLFAILIGEYLIGLLPRGSHSYTKLIRPGEIKTWAGQNRLGFIQAASLIYNPLTGDFKLDLDREDVNYLLKFQKD
jgi:2-polyprenyl-6-hydroxyphenyl methylase / 3-demethylubiquinone-9 3-methyltransferase